MRYVCLILSIALSFFLSGCIYALRPYNIPSQRKLLVRSSAPTNYVVRVAEAQEFPVASDGRVSFDVPLLPRGCDVYLFGAVKIHHGAPESLSAIHLLRDGKVVRKLSITQIDQLPLSTDGYRMLHLEEFGPDQSDRNW